MGVGSQPESEERIMLAKRIRMMRGGASCTASERVGGKEVNARDAEGRKLR